MTAVHNSPSLTLYVHDDCPHGHRIRLVLAEKGVVGYRLVAVEDDNEDLAAINPYNTTPTLVDRDLVLYEARTILEYIEERYPHPPLMPAGAVQRARYRMAVCRFETELYAPTADMERAPATVRKARASMRDALLRLTSDFRPRTTLGEAYSLLDCTLAPILWRMDHYRLQLPARQDRMLRAYADGLFRRDAFASSLSAREKHMRQATAG